VKRKREQVAESVYSVVVDGRAVVRFRQPAIKLKVGEGENALADHERRVASHCIAVLGAGEPFAWRDPSAAAFIADCIGGEVRPPLDEPQVNELQVTTEEPQPEDPFT